MDDYPGNSKNPPKAPAKKEEAARVEPIQGVVVRQEKAPLGDRFKRMLIAGNARESMKQVFLNNTVPAIQDMLNDLARDTIERTILGDRATSRRRATSGGSIWASPQTNNSKVQYHQKGVPTQAAPSPLSRAERANHDFSRLVFEQKVQADEVLTRMFTALERFGSCRVSDLYTAVNIDPDFPDYNYGWTDLRGSRSTRTHQGYVLELPQPTQL